MNVVFDPVTSTRSRKGGILKGIVTINGRDDAVTFVLKQTLTFLSVLVERVKGHSAIDC